jgi:septum formation protein
MSVIPAGNRVILASASPRRKELLSYIISEFEVIPSGIDEVAAGAPEDQVKQLAADKAADIAKQYPDALVIGADTLVAIDDRVLGKPSDEAEAADMLRMLSNREHRVYTGVAVVLGGHMKVDANMTHVQFAKLSDEEIREYIGTGEPMDKAGAYGIQGYGGKFIPGIRGDYFNVMGLPLNMLYNMLKEI